MAAFTYPAPLLAAQRPVGIAAPGTAFVLPDTITGASGGSAAVADYTREVSGGNHFLLTGLGLAGASCTVYQNGRFSPTYLEGDALKAKVRLPNDGRAWDFALAWIMAADGISAPIALNRATGLWGQEVAAEGMTISVMGRNLAHGNVWGAASYLAVQPMGGGEIRLLTGKAVNAYRAEFTITGLPVGDYYYWSHNGHGQQYGWSKRGSLKVVDRQDHVLTRNFGTPVDIQLSTTDAGANVATINNAFVQYRYFRLPAGEYPINGQISPRDNTRCGSVGTTTLRAVGPWSSQFLGMLGSNSWRMGVLENVRFINPDSVISDDNSKQFYNQSLLEFNLATGSTGNEHILLRNVYAEWVRPYEIDSSSGYDIPKNAQGIRFTNARHIFLDNTSVTGTGTYFGHCRQVFITDYTHRLTNGADHTLYLGHCTGVLVNGLDVQDKNATSGDGLTRGAGRIIKCGGQDGCNQYFHFERVVGRELGPLFTGTNPYYDRNQGEMLLWEGNRTTWQSYVVSATATTLTFSSAVVSRPQDVASGALRPDDPEAGVLPGYHLLRIARGRGLWQVRGILAVSGNAIVLDEPLDVLPDTASLIQVGVFTRGNTVVSPRLSGKRFVVDDSEFGIQCGINYYGGMHDTIVDDMRATNVRHGFIFTPTTHADGQIDGNYNCQMLNPIITGCRWGQRYESYGREEHPEWHFPASGQGMLLVRNVKITGCLQDQIVFKTPRLASEVATHWQAPPIDLLVIE